MRHGIKTTFAIFYRDLLIWWRDKLRVVAALSQPFLWTLFFGLGFSQIIDASRLATALNIELPPDFNYFYYLYPGVVAITVMFTAVGTTISLIWDREHGYLREILVAPVSRTAVALGKVFSGTVLSAFQGMIMIVFGGFWYQSISYGLITLPLLLALGFMMASLGLLVAVFIQSTQAFFSAMQFLVIPLAILSGAFFPVELMPNWMANISFFNPVYYGVDMLRKGFLLSVLFPLKTAEELKSLLLSQGPHMLTNIVVVIGFGILFTFLAAWFFRKES